MQLVPILDNRVRSRCSVTRPKWIWPFGWICQPNEQSSTAQQNLNSWTRSQAPLWLRDQVRLFSRPGRSPLLLDEEHVDATQIDPSGSHKSIHLALAQLAGIWPNRHASGIARGSHYALLRLADDPPPATKQSKKPNRCC